MLCEELNERESELVEDEEASKRIKLKIKTHSVLEGMCDMQI